MQLPWRLFNYKIGKQQYTAGTQRANRAQKFYLCQNCLCFMLLGEWVYPIVLEIRKWVPENTKIQYVGVFTISSEVSMASDGHYMWKLKLMCGILLYHMNYKGISNFLCWLACEGIVYYILWTVQLHVVCYWLQLT